MNNPIGSPGSVTNFNFFKDNFHISVDLGRTFEQEGRFVVSDGEGQYINLSKKDFFQLFMAAKEIFEGQVVSEESFQKHFNGKSPEKLSKEEFHKKVVGAWADWSDEVFDDNPSCAHTELCVGANGEVKAIEFGGKLYPLEVTEAEIEDMRKMIKKSAEVEERLKEEVLNVELGGVKKKADGSLDFSSAYGSIQASDLSDEPQVFDEITDDKKIDWYSGVKKFHQRNAADRISPHTFVSDEQIQKFYDWLAGSQPEEKPNIDITASKTRKADHVQKEPALLPCPFCGSDKVFISGDSFIISYTHFVSCGKCSAQGSGITVSDSDPNGQSEAINAWNERHTFSSVGG